MVEYAPSTGGLALWVHHHDLPPDADGAPPAPAAATDGSSIHYGQAFDALPLAEQVGLVAHEVLHIALRHVQRRSALQALLGDVDVQLYNLCADAIVHSALSHLGWLRLPAGGVGLDKLVRHTLGIEAPVEALLLAWDVETLYRALDDRPPPGGRRRQRNGRQPGEQGENGSGDQDADAPRQAQGQPPRPDGPRSARARALAAGMDADLLPQPAADSAPEHEAEQTRSWSQRILRAHGGDGPHSMLRVLVADLPHSRTPWEQVLRRQLARSLAPQPGVAWSRPSRSYLANQGRCGPGRRMPFEPGTSATKAVPRVVLVVDVSGSIDTTLLGRFSAEVESIARRLGAGLVLVAGDERVLSVQHFAPGRVSLQGMALHGSGGTDFTPLLEEADRHAPDITVVLTDLDGPARHRPRSPVLWAVPAACAAAVPPFGRLLVLR
jgi:predicted metal-dependent peptidase